MRVVGYWVAHDCGPVINPLLVDGQIDLISSSPSWPELPVRVNGQSFAAAAPLVI